MIFSRKVEFPPKKAWWREEDTFGFGSILPLTYMHLETKPCEIVVNQGQASCELITVFKRERAVVHI